MKGLEYVRITALQLFNVLLRKPRSSHSKHPSPALHWNTGPVFTVTLLWLYCDKYVQYPLFATPGPRAHTKKHMDFTPCICACAYLLHDKKKNGVSWSESWYFTAYSFPEHGMITRKFKHLCLSPYPISNQHFWVPSLNRTVGIALVEFPVRAASHRIQPSGVMFCFTEEASGWTMERHTQKSP